MCFRLEKSILTRFEKENGGELLVATLCLLEVSGRGLLEVELLSILADEENLRPKPPEENSKDKGSEKGILESLSMSSCVIKYLLLLHTREKLDIDSF